MDNFDFEIIQPNLLIDDFTRNYIQAIHLFIKEKKIFQLALKLEDFRERLIFYYTENAIAQEGVSAEDAAKIFFSGFLQHLFYYIPKNTIDLLYIKERLLAILNTYKDIFYYRFKFNHKDAVVLWIDFDTGETALFSACEQGDLEVVDGVLMSLKEAFIISSSDAKIPRGFHNYLFHENRLGYSALSMVWKDNQEDIEARLLELGHTIYGDINTQRFQCFLFQVDNEDNSALMRAVAREQEDLIRLLLDASSRVCGGREKTEFQELLIHQNKEGASALYLAVKRNSLHITKLLLTYAYASFSSESMHFENFLLLADDKGHTSIMEASRLGNKEILMLFSSMLIKRDKIGFLNLRSFMLDQDQEGYTAFMRAVEGNSLRIVDYFLNLLTQLYRENEVYDFQAVYDYFCLKNHHGDSILQIAAKKGFWEILEVTFDAINFLSLGNYKSIIGTLDYQEEGGSNVLSRLYQEEVILRSQVIEQNRERTPVEKQDSHRRRKLAKMLAKAGLETPERMAAMYSWRFIGRSSLTSRRILNFFGISCGSSYKRLTRGASNTCFLPIRDYQTFLIDNSVQLRKEPLIHLMAFFRQVHHDSIQQVRIMRNSQSVSEREKRLLQDFDQEVARYYDAHADSIFAKLKAVTAPTLEEAFASNKPYVLVDSDVDLLVLGKNEIFSAFLLNPIKSFSLAPEVSHTDLKTWLDTYFASHYTLHPFDPEVLMTYPPILEDLNQAIISDRDLLSRRYSGLRGETLRSLFLLGGQSIDLSLLTKPDFFISYGNHLYFRAERFHELFFDLSLDEKETLKGILSRYEISIANYPSLSVDENEYLTTYGAKILHLIQEGEAIDRIEPINLLAIATETYDHFFSREGADYLPERERIIHSLNALHSKSDGSRKRWISHSKAALQLLMLLLPSTIRSISKKDPSELVIPVGVIAGDVLLRELLFNLIHHPQVMKIFSGTLANKILVMLDETVERVPVVGGLLATYGLVQSGKALLSADSHDPYRPYYAHLLVNNLATIGIMGAEAVVSLPFWPVLGLFALLTFDQVMAEGIMVHDQVLHLKDDQDHPFLKFYREFKLGLGIVDANIQIVQDQRQLFQHFLDYLDKVKDRQTSAFVAVTLPVVRHLDAIQRAFNPGQKAVGCSNSPADAHSQSASYQSQLCLLTNLVVDKKADYMFELGRVREFCERRDPFYEEGHDDYTLLVGTDSVDCALGKKRVIQAFAKTQGDNAAGILLNTQLSAIGEPGNYSLFLPIDPFHVAEYSFYLLKEREKLVPFTFGASLNRRLPCENEVVDCITKIKVVIAPLYSIAANDINAKTRIVINDDALRKGTDKKGVQAIEYFILTAYGVYIRPNQIPEQAFAFLNEDYYFTFSQGTLKSENGFEVSLTGIKKLTLEFGDRVWIDGCYQPARDQQLILNTLKGISEEKKATLDISLTSHFSVSLCQNTRLLDQETEIVIDGSFRGVLLQVYRHDNSKQPVYHLLKPLNKVMVAFNRTEGLGLFFADNASNEPVTLKLLSHAQLNKNLVMSFSGKYIRGNDVFFSRVLMVKSVDIGWRCYLELDVRNFKKAVEPLNLASLRSQNFDRVDIISNESNLIKITHYFFCRNQFVPFIPGKFIDYRLTADKEGWLLTLKHRLDEEKTQVFLAADIHEIIIGTIRYRVKPALAALFALDTVDHSSIHGEDLIAPLQIEGSFFESGLSLKDNVYRIGNVSFHHLPPSKAIIYFEEQMIPFYYFKYALKTYPVLFSSLESSVSRRLEGQQTMEIKSANTSSLKEAVTQTWETRIKPFLIGGSITAMTTLLGGALFMFNKRFRRSRTPVVPPLESALPLLMIPETKALSLAEKQETTHLSDSPVCNSFGFALLEGVKDLRCIRGQSTFTSQLYQPLGTIGDLNAQLVLADYFIRHFNRVSEKKLSFRNHPKLSSSYRSMSKTTLFCTDRVARNDTEQSRINTDVPVPHSLCHY